MPVLRSLKTFDESSAGIPFRFDSLETLHKDLLDASWPSDDGNARDILDYVRGDAGTTFASPTAVQFEGHLQPPVIIILPGGKEHLYLSSSQGKVEILPEKAPRLGVYYWNLFRP